MPLENIERVPAPDVGTFDRLYLRKGQPVILTDLYANTPVARLTDRAVARAELASTPLPVRPNVIGEFLQGAPEPESRETTFGEFYDSLQNGSAPRDFCVEHHTPTALAEYLPPPAYVGIGDADDWVSHMFLAGPGNVAHLHYDGDQRHVLMYQVFGRKRYVIVDPAETRKLAPGTRPTVRRTSALFLENFAADDLDAFLRYANAWDCVLEPGEAVLIPASAWHYVEYVDVALSVNFRFGRNRHVRFLSEMVPVPSVELQALATCFRDEDAMGPLEREAFAALQAAALRSYSSPEARVAALDRLCLELCELVGLPVAGPAYHVADIARRQRMATGAEPLGSRPHAPPAPRAPSPLPFRIDEAVALPEAASVFVPVAGGGMVLATDGLIEAALPPDPTHPWTLGVVARVAREPGLRVSELARSAGAEPGLVAEFLGVLEHAGWVTRVPGSNPVDLRNSS